MADAEAVSTWVDVRRGEVGGVIDDFHEAESGR
jgi:hypothetical protein